MTWVNGSEREPPILLFYLDMLTVLTSTRTRTMGKSNMREQVSRQVFRLQHIVDGPSPPHTTALRPRQVIRVPLSGVALSLVPTGCHTIRHWMPGDSILAPKLDY